MRAIILLSLAIVVGCTTQGDDMESLALYNRREEVADLTIVGGGYRLYKPDPGTGGQARTPEAFPAATERLTICWEDRRTGKRVIHRDVSIKPSSKPPSERDPWGFGGFEVELVIERDGAIRVRRRPFGGSLDE